MNCTSTNLPPAMEVAHREEFQKRGRFRSRYRRINHVSTSSHVLGAHQKLFWRTRHKGFRKKKVATHCLKFQAVSHNYTGLCQGRWQRKTTHRLVVMATVSCQTDCVEIGQVWTQNQYHPLIPIWHFRPRLCRKMCLWHASWHSWHRCRTTTLNIQDLERQAIKAICEYDISHLNAKNL